jgi:PAS domain S-box-containing protein
VQINELDYMKFYIDKFREFRINKKLSMAQVGKRIGVDRKTISAWEHSSRIPKETKVRRLAKAIGVSPDSISDLPPDFKMTNIPQQEVEKMAATLSNFISINQPSKKLINNIKREVETLEESFNQATILINALLRSFNSMLYVKNNDQKYIILNNEFLKNLSILDVNYPYKGKKDNDFFPIKEAVQNSNEDNEVLLTGKPVIKREGVIPGSRKKKIGYISKIPVLDIENNIIGIMGIFNDMTDKIRSNEIRKCLENGLDNFSDVVWLMEKNSSKKLFYVSESVSGVYGYSSEEFYKDPFMKLEKCIHPDDHEMFLTDLFKTDSVVSREYRIKTKSGRYKWIETRANKRYFAGKECILYIDRDIDDRKKSEKNRELLEIYVDSLKEGLEIYDEESNKFVYCNKGVADIFGYPVERFYEGGVDFWLNTCVHPDFRSVQREYAGSRCWPAKSEYMIIKPNGEERWVEVTFSFNKYRGRECCICLFRDITNYKNKESNLNKFKMDIVKSLKESGVSDDIIFKALDTNIKEVKVENEK